MDVSKYFVVYELNNVLNSEKHKALEKVEFKGYVTNDFETEEDAIQALIEDRRTHEDFIIVK